MKILSIDSSAVCAGAAIVDQNKVISLFSSNSGLTHSRTLLPMIDSVLKQSETDSDDIDYLACSVGPGSFTGIRIGIATIKGLSEGFAKPCIPVSTLEGLAYNLKGNDCVACSVMDARRNQVYCALFDIDGDSVKRLCDDCALSIDELGERIKNCNKRLIFVGDGAELCHKSLGYEIASEILRFQNAASVGIAALSRIDFAVNAQEIEPVYLRLSQAERELNNKNKKGEKT